MADVTVGLASKTTITHSFAAHLATAGRTITTATVTATAGTITNISNTSTAVTFRLDASAIATTTTVTVTTTATLDNGDIDPRILTVQVAATP